MLLYPFPPNFSPFPYLLSSVPPSVLSFIVGLFIHSSLFLSLIFQPNFYFPAWLFLLTTSTTTTKNTHTHYSTVRSHMSDTASLHCLTTLSLFFSLFVCFAVDSPVFTPEDSELWLKGKHVLQVADYAQTQVVEHLYKLHLFMEPVCVCMHRHLSKLHPLHQLLKHHCRGLIGANKLGYPFLFAPDVGSLDNLLTVGRIGAVKMILRAHQLMSWDDTDFLVNIRVGIDLAIFPNLVKSCLFSNHRNSLPLE